MFINNSKYCLTEKNYIKTEVVKKQVVIGHISGSQKSNFIKWSHRLNGAYTKTAAFSISKTGKIYQHFDPVYSSNILGNNDLDYKSIVILLENDGWLIKDSEKNTYINWVGDIYNKPEEVVEKKWRNYFYWAPYTQEQFNSTLKLVNKLCEDFNIPKVATPHNTKMDDLDKFSGVLYKSNLEKYFTDLNPCWNFIEFKNKLETNEKEK